MLRLKQILKWTGVILGALVAISLVANAGFVWITASRLESQLAAIRAAGDPLSLADLARPPIPPEKNAATYLRRVEADAKAMNDEIYDKNYADNWGKQWNSEHVLSPDGVRAVKAAIAAHPKVIPLLEQAAACSDYDAGLDYTVAPNQFITQLLSVVQGFRNDARILHFRSYLLVAEGNHDEAVRSGLVLFRLARLFDRSPTLVSYLVAITLRGMAVDCVNVALQSGPVSKDVRNALDAELALQQPMAGYAWTVKSERAFVLDSVAMFPDRNFWFISRGVWNRQQSVVLDWFGRWLAIADEASAHSQSEKRIRRLSAQASQQNLPLLPAKIWGEPVELLPATQAAHNAITQCRARIRCLRVLNALQTRVPAGSNEVPKLTELGLPADTITDPFNGEPLHVKRLPQGWLAYSVGQNFQDDGGKLDNPLNGDVGVGPPSPAGKPAGY